MVRILTLVALIAVSPVAALAHKVLASVYPSGTTIEGEIGFSNGDMAKNARVTITDPDGNALGEATTSGDGTFSFSPSKPVPHVFHSDLGAGHVATATMPLDEVKQVLAYQAEATAAKAEDAGGGTAQSDGTAAGTAGGTAGGVMRLSADDRFALARMVRDEVRPLRREIDAYKEHNSLQTILGGIGYIIGLFGVGFYVAARRRMAA
ncbi:cobalt ABC transporter permease [Acidimangrovimonas pyrenivorans]|uniref:Cobalt ABC transporter permease n=1 Tax=Acidimangrovimonas pyrenivorans TaxID=2030798 RepID=A0ABV7AI61_9RHOB